MSSNIINLIQYLFAILLNKNTDKLKNFAIKVDIILVGLTIVIPILVLKANIPMNFYVVPLFIILYTYFIFLNNVVHKQYLNSEYEDNLQVNENIQNRGSKFNVILYSLGLIATGTLLFIVSNLLGNSLEKLCYIFNISQTLIGLFLGFITSIPELITFFESQKHHNKVDDNMLGVIEATNNLLTSNTVNLFVIQTVGIIFSAQW